MKAVADQLGFGVESVRSWVKQADIDDGVKPGDDCERGSDPLYQAVTALAYYWDTNPGMIRQASQALAHVLADSAS